MFESDAIALEDYVVSADKYDDYKYRVHVHVLFVKPTVISLNWSKRSS